MPRVQYIQNSFATGEITPRLYGRTDLPKYGSAVEVLENWVNIPQGGVTRRPGSLFVAETKNSSKASRMIAFKFSATTVYMLEVGHTYIRFYRNGARIESGGTPVEVVTPYQEGDLPNIDVRQSADVMYFFHAGYATQKLERYGETLWRFRAVTWAPAPSQEFGARPVATLTPAQTSCSVAIAMTGMPVAPATGVFVAADVGREILVTGGANAGARAQITGYTNACEVLALITESFVTTAATPAGQWKITASPMTGAVPAAKAPVGLATTLTLDADGWRGGINGFGTDSDCGRFAVVNGGMFEITAVTTSKIAAVTIRGEANATTKAEKDTWSLEEALWSALNGYAESATFFEGRLWPVSGFTLAGSKTGDYENFGVGVLADDAVVFAMQDVNRIRWIVAGRALLLGSTGAEHAASGGAGDVITTSNIQVTPQTNYGSAGVSPVQVGQVVLFVTRSKRKLRELVFQFEIDGYVAPDLLLLADHLTADATIEDLAYQAEPDSTIWLVRSDGVACTCAYLREQNVVAWARQVTQGVIESLATVPSTGGDEVYWIVKRTVNGATKRFVEWIPSIQDAPGFYGPLNTDCTVVYDGAATTTITGLGHLECETVTVVGDGAVYPAATVVGCEITISPAAALVEVGLSYASTLRTLPPEVPTGAGSAQPAKVRWASIMVRLLETIGLTINGDPMPFRRPSDALGEAVPLFSGDKNVPNLSAEEAGRITLAQTQPLPATVLMLTGVLDVGGA